MAIPTKRSLKTLKRLLAAGIAAGLLVCGVTPAWALSLTLEPPGPVLAGKSVIYRAVAKDTSGSVTYRWSFGDCTPGPGITCPPPVESSSPEVTHTFANAGHYSVSLVVKDASGGVDGRSLVQTVHLPVTAAHPTQSSNIVYDPVRNRVWNVNQDSGTVTATDAKSMSGIFQVAVGKQPRNLALAPDGNIWVTNQLSEEIVILAPDSGAELGRIPLPYASQPLAIAFAPSGMAYVTLFATGSLAEIDPQSREVKRIVPVGPTPGAIAISHDSRIFVTRFISPADHGEVWELSPASLEVLRTIDLAFDKGQDDGDPTTTEEPDSDAAGRGVPNYLSQMVISPDGTQGWVVGKKDNTARGPQRDGRSMSHDSFVRAIFCVIDLKTNSERLKSRVDIDNRSLPIAAAFSPLGDYVYVLMQASNFLGVYDAYGPSQHKGGIRDLGDAPDGLVLLPDNRVFVNGYLSRNLIVYDLNRSINTADHEFEKPLALVPVAQESLDPQVIRGKRIFYNAADERMSADGYMSCVACHYGGFQDGRIWDFTDRGEGLRNTKSLLGIRGTGQGGVHWSANFDEIQDFERDIRESLGGSGFMASDVWTTNFQGDPFKFHTAGLSPDLDALAAYITSLEQVNRSPYRNPDGTLTEDAVAGKKIFARAGCPTCHAAPEYTDSTAGALHDVGTLKETSGQRLKGPLTGIDTPTLKGVWQTAPYLHDGRAATLKEIFTKYNVGDRMGTTSDLSDRELDQLVAYLQQIDGLPEDDPGSRKRNSDTNSACSLSTGRHQSNKQLAVVLALVAFGFWRRRAWPGSGRYS